MAGDTEGRERRSDDLFEDLDKFFAPIKDVDWPEDRAEAAGGSERGPEAADRPEEPDLAQPTEGPAPDEQDEWGELRAKLGDDEEEEAVTRPPEAPPGPTTGDESSFMQDFLPQDREEPEESERLFPEDEVEEEGDVEASAVPSGATPEEDEVGLEDLEPEPAEISVEDLRKAPDAYRDLPGPHEGEPPAVVIAPEGLASDTEEEVFTVRPEEEDAVSALKGEGVRIRPGEGETVPAAEEEPPPGGVEAAAEHFAEAIRQSGELPVIPPGPAGPGAEPGPFDEDVLIPGPDPAGDVLPRGFEQEPPVRTVKVGATDLGPSWQESTSMEVADEEERLAGGRNIPMAFLVGVVLAVVGVGSVLISKVAFVAIAVIVVAVAQLELYNALRRRRFRPATPVGIAFGALIMAGAYAKGEVAMAAMAALAVPFTFLWYMALPQHLRRNVLVNVAVTILPLLYVPFLASFLLVILSGSTALMLSVLGLAVGFDIAAYLFGSLLGGSWFGERGLAPNISPSKTWEGLIIATLIVILVSVAALASVDPISTGIRALALALVISVAAPLGDLAESLLKRDLGVKDMGSLLPGHGGVLDRIDSLLFAAPAAFYLFRVFFS
jgi:CDP-diglyceride synthetase